MQRVTLPLTWIVFFTFVFSAATQTPTQATAGRARALTLEECIRLALEHNLRIQIERHNPNVQRLTLAADYGYYDPSFNLALMKTRNSSEGRFNPNTGVSSSSFTSEADTLEPSFTGKLPTGMSYEVGANFAHSRGTANSRPFDIYPASIGASLRQPLLKNLWTDPTRTLIRVRKKDLQISELALDDQVRQVVRDVCKTYSDLAFANEDVRVKEKAVELAQQQVVQTRRRAEVGTAAPLDERSAEAQAASARADLLAAQHEVIEQQDRLKNLITDDYAQWAAVPMEPADRLVAMPEVFQLSESWSGALAQRPDFKQLQLEAERQGLQVKLRQNQLFPALDLVGGYGRNALDSTINSSTFYRKGSLGDALDDIPSNRNPFYNVGVVLSVPLGNRTERNLYKAAKEVKKQTELRVRKLHQDILTEVHAAIALAQSAFERVAARRDARKFAEDALAVEERKVETGKSTPLDLLIVQERLTKASSDEIRAIADYNQALSDLAYKDGSILDRHKISVSVK